MATSSKIYSWDEEPCLDWCRSRQHGNKIWDISHGGSEEADVVCLWTKTCSNYSQVKDDFGRTALHAAATTGNLKAIEWLLKTQQCNINAKDMISGYTALHRSIYFGHLHVARSLIKHGADVNVRDHEGLTPFELCQMDRPITFKQNAGDMTELTIWGSNANYNLGVGHQEPRSHPDVATDFRRSEMSLAQVEMNTYHTLFRTQTGKVYSCGYGMSGRLGTGEEDTVLSPSLIQLRNNGPCKAIAAGQDHSIFLTDSKVWTVGLNEFGQLGHHVSVQKLCKPRTVDVLQNHGITGVIAGPFHSVFYNANEVYACGQNQGQFGRGFEDGKNVFAPTKLRISFDSENEEDDNTITSVGGNEFCTALCVDKRIVLLLRRNQYTKINSRSTTSKQVLKIQATGEKNSITLFLLTGSGRVLVWRENYNRSTNECRGAFTRLVFSNSRLLDVKDFSVSLSTLILISSTGEAYKSGWNCNNPPSIVGKIEEKFGNKAEADFQVAVRQRRGRKEDDTPAMALELMKIKRVPNVYTGLYAYSDPKGNNFAILQRHQMMDVTDIPDVVTTSVLEDIKGLYDDMTEDDSIHDIVFKVTSFDIFSAHRYIIAFVSSRIASVLMNDPTITEITVTNDAFGVDTTKCTSLENARVFRAILDLIYKRECAFATPQFMNEILETCCENGRKNNALFTEKVKELCRFRNLCRHLGLEIGESIIQKFMNELEVQWEKYVSSDNEPNRKQTRALINYNQFADFKFDRAAFSSFHDVLLETSDKNVFPVHKCILVARLNYFKSLFSTNWSFQEVKQKAGKNVQPPKMAIPFSSKATSLLLDCVYSNNAACLKDADCDLLCETIACSDYMMNDRLLQLAEAEMIRNISLKNAADILAFTWKHNGSQLKNTCFDFITLNLSAMLENRFLENLSPEILQELSAYYRSVQRENLSINRTLKKSRGVPDSQHYLEATKCTKEDILEQLEMIIQTDGAMMLKKAQPKATRSRVRLRSRTLSESESPLEIHEEMGAVGVTNQMDNLRLSCSSYVEESVASPTSPPIGNGYTPPLTPVFAEKDRKVVVPLPKNIIGAVPQPRIQTVGIKLEEFPTLGAAVVARSALIPLTPGKQIVNHDQVNTKSPISVSIPVTPSTPPMQTPSSSSGKKKTKWRTVSSPAEVVTTSKPSCAATASSPVTADGRDRNNPWKVKSAEKQVVFKAIVEDEVEKKRNFEKAISKSLPLMQIEDEAINFLTQHYSSEDTADFIELLTVERVVTSNFSTPTWVQHPGAVTHDIPK